MRVLPYVAGAAALAAGLALAGVDPALSAQREALFTELQATHRLSDAQMARIREIFQGSPVIGQGNPQVTVHPMSRETCQEHLAAAGTDYRDPSFERICGGPYMAPLYDPATQKPEDATACIDQFEFPNVPCDYPVVWVRAREAQELCQAMGKRLCDAHEWESGCQGDLDPPDYRFDLAKGRSPAEAQRAMRQAHNRAATATRRWSYGEAYQKGICGAASTKTAGCNGGNWKGCGSNTYPSGAFPGCHSPLGVYDINGNAAEHMNLPLNPSQMTSTGSTTLGLTEMKGSWFIFDTYHAHEDWCRWRAPYWHGTEVMSTDSHHNYHLGFRCCKSLEPQAAPPSTAPAVP